MGDVASSTDESHHDSHEVCHTLLSPLSCFLPVLFVTGRKAAGTASTGGGWSGKARSPAGPYSGFPCPCGCLPFHLVFVAQLISWCASNAWWALELLSLYCVLHLPLMPSQCCGIPSLCQGSQDCLIIAGASLIFTSFAGSGEHKCSAQGG